MTHYEDILNGLPGALWGIPIIKSASLPDGRIIVAHSASPVVLVGTGPLPRRTRLHRWWVRLRGKDRWATGQEILDRLREEARSG